MKLDNKLLKLKKIISRMDSVIIAFSGGLDSTFLLKVTAAQLPGNRVLAVTADSAVFPKPELLFSRSFARSLGIRHRIIRTRALENKKFVSNSLNRCYFCKYELFSKLKKIALKSKLKFVVDASNISDKKDFRPGNKAKEELRIRSPLQEAGLNKNDIRRLSKKLKLPTWNKPALACLASRIPYGRQINLKTLERIEKAETCLTRLGFKQVRVRDYGDLCRIEVSKEEVPRLIEKHNLISEVFKNLGYRHLTVDLEGYRTGSLNPA